MDKSYGMSDVERGPRPNQLRPTPRHAACLPSKVGWLCASLLLGVVVCIGRGAPLDCTPQTLREQAVAVVFTVRIVPRGEEGIASPEIRMRLPVKLPQQTISKLEVEGKPARRTDAWDSPVLVYERAALQPGEMLTGRWTASARVREFQWGLPPLNNRGAKSLPAKERDLYLRDAAGFALTNPVILSAAQQACVGRSNEFAKVEGIFDLVMERLNYDRDGKWDPAPEALVSGKGSCSEYSYAFIALCRVSGIPARYVGGLAGRADVPFHLDTVFHRYPQAFLSGLGWVDFDPTRTDNKKDRRLFFGRTSPNMLLLCVGDGGDGSLTGWDYLESHRWSGGAPKAARIRAGWWFPEPPPKVRKAVASFRQTLSKPRPNRNALVAEALRIGHPFVLPWLDDLLYEPAARVDAARAFLTIGGDGALRAIVNSLGRLPDSDGDREIGALLNSFTGQQWGDDRAKWQEWLKTRPAPVSTPVTSAQKQP